MKLIELICLVLKFIKARSFISQNTEYVINVSPIKPFPTFADSTFPRWCPLFPLEAGGRTLKCLLLP